VPAGNVPVRPHAPYRSPLNASAHLGLLPRGGSRIGDAARVKPEDVPAVSAALRAQIQRDLQAERSNDPGAQSKAVATKPGATVTLAAAGGSAGAEVPSRAAVAAGSGAAAVATKPGATVTLAAAGDSAKAVVPSRAAVAVGSGAAAVATKPGATVTLAAARGSAGAEVPSRAAAAVGSGAAAVTTKPGATVTFAAAGGSANALSRVGPWAHVRGGHRAQSKAVATKPGDTVTFAAAGGSAKAVVPSRAAVRSGAAVSKVGPGGSHPWWPSRADEGGGHETGRSCRLGVSSRRG